jgi:hypothetical protein
VRPGRWILPSSRVPRYRVGVDQLTATHKWLIYPVLLIVYGTVAGIPLIAPIVPVSEAIWPFFTKSHERERALQELTKRIDMSTEELRRMEAAGRRGDRAYERRNIEFQKAIDRRESIRQQSWSLADRLRAVAPLVKPVGISALVWLIVGLLAARFPGVIRTAFYPFAERFSRRTGLGLAVAGAALGIFMWMGLFLAVGT